ncbi:hypothetical protein [Parablautia sp. Marseille-Q6255]|uniref:hypothetical protein n=1 Tax=Parablautia sp. Marseille-Q6255 TaxID=3039593 RepID=UPI0024BC126D|nr:hypothetical protein [Parablautia sp. Marseille-Q6255]
MKSAKRREKTIYDDSLTRIFFWSGFSVFVIMLLACLFIGVLVFFYRGSDPEGIKIILFCLALVVPCSYGIPLISLFKAWKQQCRLGIFWRDRTDQHRPQWQRDWYLTCDRGGFILCHRAYIRCIMDSLVEAEIGDHVRGKVYYVVYEDMDGKKRKLKFSSDVLAAEFQNWFEKQPYENSEEKER